MKSTRLVRVVLIALALFLMPFLACPAGAQLPRGNRLACAPPEIYVDTTNNPRLCACTAANAWQCAALK
jgi:hypothetical protein